MSGMESTRSRPGLAAWQLCVPSLAGARRLLEGLLVVLAVAVVARVASGASSFVPDAVIATGYIYGDPAGLAATIVKLTRTVAVSYLTDVAKLLVVMVLASVEVGMSLEQIRKMGVKPLLIGLFVGAVMGIISLGLIRVAGIA